MAQIPSTIALTLPDGSTQEVDPGTTPLEVAAGIGEGLARATVGAELDGQLVDIRLPMQEGGRFRLITTRDPEAGIFIRHSAEHVMADAVQRLWPDVEIDAGRKDHSEKYQYDFRFPRSFTAEDLERIEEKMREILEEDSVFERLELSREEAADLFQEMGETLKVERLKDIPEGDAITIYRDGPFTDLCRGPHVQRLSQIGAVKLLEASGVYWKGVESNEMLQRIYGTAFGSKKELNRYLEQIEEAKKRDHRRLGVELDLFSFNDHAPASPFFHPKGTILYNGLVDLVRELQERHGFSEVITPQVLDIDLWHTSGHYENYREAMFFTELDEREYAVKPMNCPSHCLIYKTRKRSYRDLPIRYSDFGRLHRYERSGVTSGLTRVRTFAQDDAHVFCTDDQIEEEVVMMVNMILELYDVFAFENLEIEVSTRPAKSIGTAEMWERAETVLRTALENQNIEFDVTPGEGAFYGPKIDFQVSDALSRQWQLGTVQLDYQMPERFDMSYVGADGAEHRPVMIHRAMLGSIERFLGILIEHTGGAFPIWLAPVQAIVLPVSEKFAAYGASVQEKLVALGIRAQLDGRNEKLGYKIRDAQLQKIPYMLVVGAKEEESSQVAVRLRTGKDRGPQDLETFAEPVLELIAERSRDL